MPHTCFKKYLLLKLIGIALYACSQGFCAEAGCTPTIGGVKRFGTLCNYRCHCLNITEQCHFETGACTSGCDYEWTGPGCQYENIAFGEDSRHLDNTFPPHYTFDANDRDVTSCSFTGDATTGRTMAPWWALWLPHNATFREFLFTTLDGYLPYFPGFNVTVQQGVSNSDHEMKIYNNGHLCYQHDNSTPRHNSVHVKCHQDLVGNQLRIQLANISTQLVLCDVRVYGDCKDRTWGSPCLNECGFCENLAPCDGTTGQCPSKCEKGYKATSTCKTECDFGTYGRNCSSKCDTACLDLVCDKENGVCTNGCQHGFTGGKCDKSCLIGFYGQGCKERCSVNCAGGLQQCDKSFGTCLSGCTSGWVGRKCDIACRLGFWGLNCQTECNNCLLKMCRNTDGLCQAGCIAGLKNTKFCDEECDDGAFGINCTEKCSNTCYGICNKINGHCERCKPGWFGENCSQACKSGYWGENCLRACGKCLSGSCDRFNGSCSEECQPGYKMKIFCDEECENGRYGNNCSEKCSCDDPTLCRKSDGHCFTDCHGSTVSAIIGGTVAVVIIITGFLSAVCYFKHWRLRNNVNNNSRDVTVTFDNVGGSRVTGLETASGAHYESFDTDNNYETLAYRNDFEHGKDTA